MLDKILKEKGKVEQDFKNILNRYIEIEVKEIEAKYIEYNGIKTIVYNEDKNISEILARYINLDNFLLVVGFDKNYAFMSNIADCQKIVKKITNTLSDIKGGGSLKKANIKLDRVYSKKELFKIIEIGTSI